MLEGLMLVVAAVALLVALMSLPVALLALGVASKNRERIDAVCKDVTELHAHRLRIDDNVMIIARRLQSPPRVVIATREPGRPQ